MNEQYRTILDACDVTAQFELAHETALQHFGREQLGEKTIAVLWTMLEKQFGNVPEEVLLLVVANVVSRKNDLAAIIDRVRSKYLGLGA